MIKRFRLFLGPARLQALVLLLIITGLLSFALIIFVGDTGWARDAQTALVLVFIIGAAIIIGGRLDPYERGRWAGILLPAFGAVLIGVLFLPHLLPLIMGLTFGWIVAGLFLFRARGQMEYQQAVKHMRKNEYAEAVKIMDGLIRMEPDQPNHYRFRAEILRLWGRLDRARRDYQKMTQVAPDSAVAFNGLAEVELQSGSYQAAHAAALKAFDLAPSEWVAAYNLGMIEDRLKESHRAIQHLDMALKAGVPDTRHRLLIHFYRARAFARLGDMDAARQAIQAIKKHRGGLNEWQVLLQSDQADTLRAVLEEDIKTAQALANGELEAEALA